MANEEVILKFNELSFEYGAQLPVLHEVNFSLRHGMKFALMGQNGAGKSTIFNLITGDLKPESGTVTKKNGLTIAIAKQIVRPDQLDLTVRDFFQSFFNKKIYDLDPRIETVLEVVHLDVPLDRTVRLLSGGQQARLLLASALIQDPELLLLDEPTNNLDHEGLEHLTQFLKDYQKTCIVISHDADFLNAFTHGVLYLDVHTRQVEQYMGN
jgi:ATPase subunit of ABC transporter with duplicated ATPase domains